MDPHDETILITGAAGLVGGFLRPRLARPGRTLRLLDVADVPGPGPDEDVRRGSVTDHDVLAEACAGVAAVVHLGGIAGEASWDDISAVNIHGTVR